MNDGEATKTDKTDTSPDAVEQHLDMDHNHEAGLIPMGTQIFIRALSARVAELEASLQKRKADTSPEADRLAPVQGYSAGIPWAMHLRAYDAYCKRYGPQPALIKDGCRGGFGTEELDVFIPNWRDELSQINVLSARVAELEAERDAAKEDARWAYIKGCNDGDNDEVLARVEAAELKQADLLRAALNPALIAEALYARMPHNNASSNLMLAHEIAHYILANQAIACGDAVAETTDKPSAST